MNMTKKNKFTIIKIIVSALLFGLSFVFHAQPAVRFSVLLSAYVIAGYDVIILAMRKLFRGRALDENFLMSIASIGAICIGEIHEGIFVMLFYKVGELFENMAVARSRQSVTSLLEKMPNEVTLLRNGAEIVTEPDMLVPGDVILVRPGEKIAADGVITEGAAAMDTSAITGESAPREYGVGDEVFSGFVSMNGALQIRITKAFTDSTVYKILEMVESATAQKSKAEHFISKFAKIYTPIVVGLSAVIALIVPMFTGFSSMTTWLHRAFVFLVVSCPCALVISVPLGFFGGIAKASNYGILIKGSNYIERLAHMQTVAFDKTGTLTGGVFEISDVVTNGMTKTELLQIAAAVEKQSKHKLADAIVRSVGDVQVKLETFEELSGLGVRATVDGKTVLCGSRKFMVQQGVADLPEPCAETSVYVSTDGVFAGRIKLSDSVRSEAADTLKLLKQYGVKHIAVLTGDYSALAENMKATFGIDEVCSDLLPQDKVKKIEEYMANGVVAFVGDGINDAPVLARADIGIAMGAMGTDVAIEAADIVLLDDSVRGVADAIKISKQTMRIVKQNIIFAIGVKLAVLVLGAFGIAGMWEAVFADVGVSVIAILNSMRLILAKKKRVIL